jgi:uncharacterized membrane protein YkoI
MINFHSSLEQLQSSEEFKKFRKKNPKSFLCAGFFVKDYENNIETAQLDFFLPKNEKVMTFNLGEKIAFKEAETIKKEIFPEIKAADVKNDLEQALTLAELEGKKNNIEKFSKVISILQMANQNIIWNLTCLAGLTMLRVHIDAFTGKILKSEKSSLFDIIRVEKGKNNTDYIR